MHRHTIGQWRHASTHNRSVMSCINTEQLVSDIMPWHTTVMSCINTQQVSDVMHRHTTGQWHHASAHNRSVTSCINSQQWHLALTHNRSVTSCTNSQQWHLALTHNTTGQWHHASTHNTTGQWHHALTHNTTGQLILRINTQQWHPALTHNTAGQWHHAHLITPSTPGPQQMFTAGNISCLPTGITAEPLFYNHPRKPSKNSLHRRVVHGQRSIHRETWRTNTVSYQGGLTL